MALTQLTAAQEEEFRRPAPEPAQFQPVPLPEPVAPQQQAVDLPPELTLEEETFDPSLPLLGKEPEQSTRLQDHLATLEAEQSVPAAEREAEQQPIQSNPEIPQITFEEQPAKFNQVKEMMASQPGFWEKPLQSTRAVLDGLVFGASDELGAGVAAAMASVIHGANYFDTYDDMMSLLQEERDQFASDHPVANVGLNIAGGILSPANIIGGAALTGKVANAGKLGKSIGLDKLATGAAKFAPAEGAGALKVGAKAAGVLAAEGAVEGAMSSRAGERLEGAGYGAAGGALFSGAISGVTQVARLPFVRKVARDLVDKAGEFTPINIAAQRGSESSWLESGLQIFYQQGVGGAAGSGDMIRKQSEPFIRRAHVLVQELGDAVQLAKHRTKTALVKMRQSVKNRAGSQNLKAKQDRIRLSKPETERVVARKAADVLEKSAREGQKVRELQDLVQDMEEGFRRQGVEASHPRSLTEKQATELINMEPQEAVEQLAKWWQAKGFDVTKKRKFRINPSNIEQDVMRKIENNSLLLASDAAAVTEVANEIVQQFEKFLPDVTTSAWVNGAALTNLRSRLSTRASNETDPVRQYAMQEIVAYLDGIMEKALSGKGLEKFLAEKAAWQANLIYRGSVGAAVTSKGYYKPDGWLISGRQVNKRASDQGRNPLQGQASEIKDQADEAATVIDAKYAEILQDMTVETTRIAKHAEDALAEIDRGYKAKLKAIQNSKDSASVKLSKMQEVRAKYDGPNGLKAQQRAASAAMAELMAKVPSENSSYWQKMLATTLVSTVMGGFVYGSTLGEVDLGAGWSIALGIVSSPVLARKYMQMAAAGQTGWQKTADAWLKGVYDGARTTERATARAIENQTLTPDTQESGGFDYSPYQGAK